MDTTGNEMRYNLKQEYNLKPEKDVVSFKKTCNIFQGNMLHLSRKDLASFFRTCYVFSSSEEIKIR